MCGPSGSGKTTLLRHLKPTAAPTGVSSGIVYFAGQPLTSVSARDGAAKIGFVAQSAENQLVTDKVWHELAFGLESLGLSNPEIRLRVAETSTFFGIQTWFHKQVSDLSGGQKQLLVLASVIAMQPQVLILDEPTGQLDPLAVGDFFSILKRINLELGITVVLSEHRLEEAFPLSDYVIALEAGRIIAAGTPATVGESLSTQKNRLSLALPTPMRIWQAVSFGQCPISVRDGANWLAEQDRQGLVKHLSPNTDKKTNFPHKSTVNVPAVVMDQVWFRYGQNLPDILKGLFFTAYYGQLTAILGGNGTGKTTMLALLANLLPPYRGKVIADMPVYALPQNPQTLFVGKTIREDLLEALSGSKLNSTEKLRRIMAMACLCRLEPLLEVHPYDLSGGEQQRAALAKVLLLEPKILLLDEPTKGLDADFKLVLASIIAQLTQDGAAVIMVSHDIEFCAEHAQHCSLLFDGYIVTENTPQAFFAGHTFYTTAANRMARNILPQAITVSDVISALKSRADDNFLPQKPKTQTIAQVENISATLDNAVPVTKNTATDILAVTKSPLNSKQKKRAVFWALLLMITIATAFWRLEGFTAFLSGGSAVMVLSSREIGLYVGVMSAITVEIIALIYALSQPVKTVKVTAKSPETKSSRLLLVSCLVVLVAVPLTIYLGGLFLGNRKYYFIALLIILETMLPLAISFEIRKPQAKELTIMATLSCIIVAGRSAFFMLPQFKPVSALVIIAGVSCGPQAGFLIGAVSAFVSNMFFGQGPWTPWQMFTFGLMGFLSGLLAEKGILSREPASLSIFGAIVVIVVYGGLMNSASVLIFQPTPTTAMFYMSYLQGLPFDLVHAAATVTFLALISRPMLEKLDRLKNK